LPEFSFLWVSRVDRRAGGHVLNLDEGAAARSEIKRGAGTNKDDDEATN
jgi:hypothetical protein